MSAEWDESRLIADVEAGPQGPEIGAFFDFDGTLIDGYSLGAFARHHLRSGHVTPVDIGRMLLVGLRGVTTEEDFEDGEGGDGPRQDGQSDHRSRTLPETHGEGQQWIHAEVREREGVRRLRRPVTGQPPCGSTDRQIVRHQRCRRLRGVFEQL